MAEVTGTATAGEAKPQPEPVEEEEGGIDSEGLKAALSHADRCWKAEEANATRLASRANLVISGVSAIIGLKLYAMGREVGVILEAPPGPFPTLFWVFGLLSGFFLLTCLVIVLGIRRWELTGGESPNKSDPPTASGRLGFSESELSFVLSLDADEVTFVAFQHTIDAYKDLQERNATRKQAVDNAQRRLFWGIICLAFSMATFVWVDYSQKRERSVKYVGSAQQVGSAGPVQGQSGRDQ